jgi:AAA family ATP:ADP antiporter
VVAADVEKPDLRLTGKQAILLALLMAAGAGFILCGYELVRTSANTLFVTTYGKEALPLGMGLIPVGVSLVLYLYGRLLSWLGPRGTLLVTTLMSVVTIAACYVGIFFGIKSARGVLFVFKESYVVLLIEQYWSYIDSLVTKVWARRLNGPITGVASIGAVAGGELLYRLSGRWGTTNMVLLAAAVTLPAMWFSDLAYRYFGEPADRPRKTAGKGAVHHSSSYLGLDLFKKERVLLLLFGLVMSAQIVSTAQELLFKSLLQDHFPNPDVQNAISGRFYMWLNLGAMSFQLVATPLLLSFVPLSVINVVIPCIHLGTLTYSLMAPASLLRAEVAYFLFKSIDYSLFRSAKELFYVPLSFDVRYRAKEIIDVFGYRASKGLTSMSITLSQQTGVVFSNPIYATIGLCGAAIWLGMALPLARYGQGK